MESFKAYYYSRYQKGGGLPGQAPQAPVAAKPRAPKAARPRKVGLLTRLFSGFIAKAPRGYKSGAKGRKPTLLHQAIGSSPTSPGTPRPPRAAARKKAPALDPARVVLKLAGLLTPVALLILALVLMRSPVFTQPAVVPGSEPPPLVVRQEKDLAAQERIASTEGTNEFVRLDQIAELTDENGNEIDLETLNPYRLPEHGEPRSPVEQGKAFSTHRVKSGDTVWTIARKYRVNVDGVVTLNRLAQASRLSTGDILKIPRLPGVFHEVRKNETVEGIARTYGVSADDIRTYNAIGPYLSIGTVLFIYKAKLPASQRAGAFGANFIMPVRGFLTSPYGMRHHPIMRTPLFHTGIDIAANQGERVSAAEEGTVTFVGESGWSGDTVIIRHASGYETVYGHLSRYHCASGRRVKKGDLIGEVGSTGMSTGPHLHFEIRFRGQYLNPLRFVTPQGAPSGVASSDK